MRTLTVIAALAACAMAPSAFAAPAEPSPAAATPAAAPAKVLTIDSLVGDLIDNPKTDAVLKKLVPATRNNDMFSTVGRELSLKEVAEFEAELTEEKLKLLATEFAKAQAPEAKP